MTAETFDDLTDPPTGLFVRLYLSTLDDPDLAELSFAAMGAWSLGLMLAKRLVTDGVIPKALLRKEARGRNQPEEMLDGIARELVLAGVWSEEGDSYQIRSWTKYNRSVDAIGSDRRNRTQAAIQANHQRWHVGTGRASQKCPLCVDQSPNRLAVSEFPQVTVSGGSDSDPIGLGSDPIGSIETETERETERSNSSSDVCDDRPELALAHQLCGEFVEHLAILNPEDKPAAVRKSWVTAMDRMLRLDGRTPEQIRNALAWLASPEGEFWGGVTLSVPKLRKNWPSIRSAAKQAGAKAARAAAPTSGPDAELRQAFATAERTYNESRGGDQPGERWRILLEAEDPRVWAAIQICWQDFGDTKRRFFVFRDAWAQQSTRQTAEAAA